jgi:glycosyltransferase involved in cell wall biosynthesis
MKVTLANTYTSGGAAKAALRLHRGLKTIGVDSRFLCLSNSAGCGDVVHPVASASRWHQRLARRLHLQTPYGLEGSTRTRLTESATCELFSDCRVASGRRVGLDLSGMDVLNLHWIARFLDLPTVFKQAAGKIPIVWTLHDMQAITGGCHYTGDCRRFISQCHSCPQLLQPGISDASAEIFAVRNRVMSQIDSSDLHVVSPSQWLLNEAQESAVFSRFPKSVIPYGIDTSVFRPIDKAAARTVLGLPRDRQVILFVADSVNNPRKGMRLLASALSSLAGTNPNIVLAAVGSGALIQLEPQTTVFQFGRIEDERLLAAVYSAADVFVIPSLQDNLPNTMLESLACGTPVIGLPVGGIPDAVRSKVTGWLAEDCTVEGLVEAIRLAMINLLNPEYAAQIGASCRRVAETEYSLRLQANRYRDLFASLV